MTATVETKTKKTTPREVVNKIVEEQAVSSSFNDDVPNKVQQLYQEERRKVRGIFKCFEPVGGSVKFSCKKYKEEPPITMTMVDGEEYEIPLWLARHLNNDCWYPTHSHVLDAQGKPTVAVGKKNHRYAFQSLDFI